MSKNLKRILIVIAILASYACLSHFLPQYMGDLRVSNIVFNDPVMIIFRTLLSYYTILLFYKNLKRERWALFGLTMFVNLVLFVGINIYVGSNGWADLLPVVVAGVLIIVFESLGSRR